jgi:hypothetical protein
MFVFLSNRFFGRSRSFDTPEKLGAERVDGRSSQHPNSTAALSPCPDVSANEQSPGAQLSQTLNVDFVFYCLPRTHTWTDDLDLPSPN